MKAPRYNRFLDYYIVEVPFHLLNEHNGFDLINTFDVKSEYKEILNNICSNGWKIGVISYQCHFEVWLNTIEDADQLTLYCRLINENK